MIKIDNNKIHILRLLANLGSYGNYKIKRCNKADRKLRKQMTQKHKKICFPNKNFIMFFLIYLVGLPTLDSIFLAPERPN